MRRREFITIVGGAAASWPLAARAQQATLPVIGFLSSGSSSTWSSFVDGFRRGLSEAGFVAGQNVTIEYRWADGQYDRLPALAADLVGQRVAVIFAAGGPDPARAAKAATSTIPIAFYSATDPVKAGLVPSFNRPGGNITGVSIMGSVLEGKRLELLHELVPKASTIGVLIDPNYPSAESESRDAQEAAARFGVTALVLAAGTEQDIDTAFATLAQRGAGALLVTQNPLFLARREQLFALAMRHGLPAMYSLREFPVNGGLASYGPDFKEGFRQAGIYVGRILKGTRPADLPVLQPTKFELVINLKTAKALGLDVPDKLLALADEVIE
jgi:putative tryptophan/tyrosine transport system substrate-binding protein